MGKLTVEDASLVSVADAIRTKGGTTDQLVFPDGFVSAIDGIKTGSPLIPLVDKSITEVTADMLEGCTKIGDYAFYGCFYLTSVVIPDGVRTLSHYAFYDCRNLTSITLPESAINYGSNVFDSCRNLTSITLPEGATVIEMYMFYNSGIKSLTIPDSVTKIESNAFNNCLGLISIIIPNNVTKIGYSAFAYCRNLTTVEMKSTTPPDLSSNVFYNCNALTQIIVPAGTLSTYKSATNWSKYASYMVEASS